MVAERDGEPARYISLEVCRGVAVLLVVVHSVYQYTRSGPDAVYPYEGTIWHPLLLSLDAGVGWLFIIAAYLVGLPYARAALDGNAPTSGRLFLFRRSVQIVPLYAISILVVWSLRNRSLPGNWIDLLEHLTFTQVFDDRRIFFTIGPAWSIAVEVQFYLLLALVAPGLCDRCRLLATRDDRRSFLLTRIAGVALVSIVWKLVAYSVFDVDESSWWVWFGLPAKLDVIAVGLLLAVVVAAVDPSDVGDRVRLGLGTAGGGVLLTAILTRSTIPLPTYVYFHLVAAIGFGLLVAASVLGRTERGDARQARRAGRAATSTGVALGLVSYSLYLWHEPVMLFLASNDLFPTPGSSNSFLIGTIILVPVASAIAWISYWVIEYPTGMLRRSRAPSGARRDYYDER